MQGAQALVRVLEESGVDCIFGLPGDTGTAFYDALRERRGAIRHVLTRDERSASFMADAYARVSGRIGVCEGPSGGGATYIVPGVAEAHGSSIPVLCLTTDIPVSQRGRGVLTEFDQNALFSPITKWTHAVDSADTLGEAVRRAMRLATTGRPGAVHLVFPSDVLEATTPAWSVYGSPRWRTCPAYRNRPDPDDVMDVVRLLHAAERPVIVAGGGVVTSGASDALTAFAESLAIPVATSINGKGSVRETSEIAAGVVGGNGAWSFTNDLVNAADLVIFAGTRTGSTTTHHWSVPPLEEPPTVVQIDIDPWAIGNTYPVRAALFADARASFEDLLAAVDDPTVLRSRWSDRLAAVADAKRRHVAAFRSQAGEDAWPVHPAVVVDALQQLLPDDALIVADPGTPTPYLAAGYQLRRAGRSLVIPRAHGGLGYAIPAAVGAALAAPGRMVVALTGDGSFGMACGELETIRRLQLPIVIIQCANQTFGWIKELQHLYHGDRYFSVDFSAIDAVGVARGFGLHAESAGRAEEVMPAISRALGSGAPAFVDVPTAPPTDVTPPVASWQEAERIRASGGA